MHRIASSAWYTRLFWAKSWPYRQRGPDRIHLLENHLADVGACLEALLAQPTVRQRLANTVGREELDDTTVGRLCVFAALHDIGKVNIGFQAQVWKPGDMAGGRRIRRTGHTLDLVPVLNGADERACGWFFDALGWSDMVGWDDQGGGVVSDLLIATLSHHGLPLGLESGPAPYPQVWRPIGVLDPEGYVRRVGELVRGWFPAAWDTTAPPLPAEPSFQHMFLGLCTLADWLGSNEHWFPYRSEPDAAYIDGARDNARRAVAECGLDIEGQRRAVRDRGGLPSFTELFGYPSPNAIQQQAALQTPLDERLVVVESETGSGKTEAALWRFAHLYETNRVDGLYFALPTRAAATQMHERIRRFASSVFPNGQVPPVILAVPGYPRSDHATGKILQRYKVWWDDHPNDATRRRRWAAEHSKRYLAAQIAVGTVDQAMMAALKVKHSHMRAACLARNLLVIDEVHASDTYMGVILQALLDTHLGAGGHALLMSATLGSVARRRWLGSVTTAGADSFPLQEAIRSPYPVVSTRDGRGERMVATGENGQDKAVRIESVPLMDHFDAVAERVLDAARAGAKVLVIRNTVGHAIHTQRAIEDAVATPERKLLFGLGGVPAQHHGRFAACDRFRLDRLVEERLGKNANRSGGGLLLVGTQTLEQSLDIDADLLVTDLCPVDVLLQRIGRLHRHAGNDRPPGHRIPICVVLLPGPGNLTPLLERGVNGLNQFVYPDLRILEATRRLVAGDPEWVIPSINRWLVERATHREALEAITEELGGGWLDHAYRVKGGELAEGLTARGAVAVRDKSFCRDNHEVTFGSLEDRIRTRLGDEGIEVDLDPPQPSPFGVGEIKRMVVPRRWLPERWEDDPAVPEHPADGFTFSVGGRQFLYNRLGLQRYRPGPTRAARSVGEQSAVTARC